MYSLKEVCEMLDMTEHTVRFYTDQGIVDVKRDANNRRLFDEQAVDLLRGAKYLRSLGMSVEDVRTFHQLCKQDGDEAIRQRLEILLKQEKKAKEELEDAQHRLLYLEHKIEKEKMILQHTIPDAKNPWKKKY